MITIIKRDQLLPVKIGEIIVYIKALTYSQKIEIDTLRAIAVKDKKFNLDKTIRAAFKYSIQKIEGIQDIEGNKIKLDLDENGNLTESSIDLLISLSIAPELIITTTQLINDVPAQIINEVTGKPLEGVEILIKKKKTKKK